MFYSFKPSEPRDKALRRLARELVEASLSLIAAAREGEQVDRAVHDVRKHGKSMRALLRLYRPGIGESFRREDDWIRDTASLLGPWRDEHVLDRACERLFKEELELLAAARRQLFESVLVPPDRVELERALEEVDQRLRVGLKRIEALRVDSPSRAIVQGARRIYQRGRERFRRCTVDSPAEDFHAWRKEVKYHWNHAKLFRRIQPELASAYVAEFKRLGDLVGEHHDLSVLRNRMTDKAIIKKIDERIDKLQRDALQLGALLYTWPPRLVAEVVRALIKKS